MRKSLLFILCIGLCLCTFAKSKPSKKKSEPTVKVACVGNSITYGYGLENRDTESYPVQLQKMLGEKYKVKNFGKSGATLLYKGHRPYVEQEEFRQAKEFAGDIVVIHLGINDTDPRDWPNYRDDFVNNYLSLIDSFRSFNPNARILIARLSPISDRHHRFQSGTRDWHGEIQIAIETIAKIADVQLIDFHEPLYVNPFLFPDGLHPNNEGAKIMANVVYSAITGNYGGLKMPILYTDNMILQRDIKLNIKGMANSGDKITVSIAGQKRTTTTSPDGKWTVTLDPLKAGGPYTLHVSTLYKRLEYKNVLVGEVWLCSGQSNMEFMLKQAITAERDIPAANDTHLRLFDIKARRRTDAVEWDTSVLDSINHLQYFTDTKWNNCTPESAANFSAIAYYFGKMLRDSLQIPIGLICNAVGGSPTESWIDRHTLEYEFPQILHDRKNNDFIQQWVRERAALNIKQSSNALQRHPYEPCYLYESGILPFKSFQIKGVIWYQGESNAHNKDIHMRLFGLLVGSWRKYWKNENMPFYYVQLSSLNRPSWTWFRDSQRLLAEKVTHSGMVVSSDCGDSLDVHPKIKEPIGNRLGYMALNKTYGFKHVVPSGPLPRKTDYFENGKVIITFDYGEGMKSADGAPLRTFEIAETDGLFCPAEAKVLTDNRIELSNDKVKHPRYVRYGWQPFTRANLINNSGLPASTFRLEK